MGKKSKRIKELREKIDRDKIYPLEEAVTLIKEISNVKFDASVEVHVNLGIDPKKGDQIIRSSVMLPHGNGKVKKIIAFTTKVEEAKKAGADIIGDEDYIKELKKTSKCDFDVAVATPEMMPKIASIAKILGQKGLMPNPKSGTIGPNVVKMIEELKKGKEAYKNDDSGNLHLAIGKISFDDQKLIENITEFINSVRKVKPSSLKSTYVKSITVSSSMGPGIKISV
ncbi:50S ribosomal protein L1 [bacterium]|nr:50S ribosomal protein L1 [bacterium]